MPKMESAEWNCPDRVYKGKEMSQSAKFLRNIKLGEVKRIVHDDLACHGKSSKCSLSNAIFTLEKASGCKFEHYHEAAHVAVVRRIK